MVSTWSLGMQLKHNNRSLNKCENNTKSNDAGAVKKQIHH